MIEFKQVSKTFATASGQVAAVKNVDLTINAGEVYGIVGFSGAGKSTLVRMLNGLETPTSGEVIINGKRIDNLKGKELRDQRKKIGIIFQHFNLLWSRTVLENIEFPLELVGVAKEERRKKAKHLAELVGLGERINAYPSQLSGGQKQRVGIARALATDPDILISDEATSALDPQTTDEVHVIRRLSDKVAVMENGQVIEEGPVSEVFTHPKEELTKRFVSAEVDTKQTTDVKQVVTNLLEKNPQGKLVELKFHGQQVERPVINELSKSFPELEISILEGSIHQLADKGTIGSLFVQLVGPAEQLKEALTLLEKLQVEAKVIEHG